MAVMNRWPVVTLVLVTAGGAEREAAAGVPPPAGVVAQAGNGGIRGPGVLNVISVIAFTLRFP